MNVVRGVTPEMIAATKAKYTSWDRVVNRNWLEKGTPEQRNRAYLMLKDPTIYSYAFFRNPWNPSKSFKLYPYQDMVINDPSDRVIFAAANQIGKSISLDVDALVFALNVPGTTTLMTSLTLPQSKDLLMQIKMFLQNSRLDYQYDIGDTETKTEIYFKHFDFVETFDVKLQKKFNEQKKLPQSRIICVPATGAALSYAVHLEMLDELAFYEDGEYLYEQILQPRTYTTKGRIKTYSNPNGQQGIFWKLWNDKRFSKYSFNFFDCPTNTQKEYDEISVSLTRERIDSTLLGVFTNPEGGFLTLQERRAMQEDRSSMLPPVFPGPIYIFYDWGKAYDRTVRAIGVPVRVSDEDWADAVKIYELKEYPQGTPYTEIVDDLKDLIESVGMKMIGIVGWDNSGVGRGLEDFVKRVQQIGIMANPVEFSLENKSRIYTLFKLLAEQRRIKIPRIDECDKQLSTLRFKKSARGHLQVHHENEKDRDDFPDAIAGLCSLIIQPDNPPITCEII